MTHPEITIGDYLVCKESKGNVYGSTTDLEIVKVTRRTDSTSLMVEIILTVDPSDYKKEVIGEKFGIHRRNFDIVRKFSDLPENIRKGLSSGKFTGNVPKQFIPGFAGFVAALVVSIFYRLLIRSFLWMRSAFTDPNKFWTSFKLFEIKDYR